MPDSSPALRRVSDTLLRDLEVLATLEEQKRAIPADDPLLREIATRIAEIAERVLVETRQQAILTEAVHREAAEPHTSAPAIDDLPRSTSTILADWRAAERRREAAAPGSVEAAEAEALAERLRDEYRRAWQAAKDA